MTPDQIFDGALPEPNSGCWLWLGRVDKDGYGRHGWKAAHRLSYEAFKGEIPTRACVLHSCDQPCCVNPDHLRCGSHLDNSRDRVARGRASATRGEEKNFAKLTEENVRAIRADPRRARYLAAEYGVDVEHIRRIRRRQYWAHVA